MIKFGNEYEREREFHDQSGEPAQRRQLLETTDSSGGELDAFPAPVPTTRSALNRRSDSAGLPVG